MGAALHWVRENIAAFGGDPAQVCLMGQSGGAMSTAILAQHPAYRSCFQKAVLLSPPAVSAPISMTPGDASAYTELLASRLETTPRGLREVPAQALHEAELALNLQPLPARFTSGQGFKLAPLIDGTTYLLLALMSYSKDMLFRSTLITLQRIPLTGYCAMKSGGTW